MASSTDESDKEQLRLIVSAHGFPRGLLIAGKVFQSRLPGTHPEDD